MAPRQWQRMFFGRGTVCYRSDDLTYLLWCGVPGKVEVHARFHGEPRYERVTADTFETPAHAMAWVETHHAELV